VKSFAALPALAVDGTPTSTAESTRLILPRSSVRHAKSQVLSTWLSQLLSMTNFAFVLLNLLAFPHPKSSQSVATINGFTSS
jgi:hypothetical protein